MSAYSIDVFKGLFGKGMARANRYRVVIPVGSTGQLASQKLDFLCDSVTIPGRQIKTTERQQPMFEMKMGYGMVQDNVSMTFYIDNDWTVWNFIQEWHKKIVGGMENNGAYKTHMRYYDDYAKNYNIDIYQLDVTSGKTLKHVKLIEAFPFQLSSITLGNDNGELIKCSVEFYCLNWVDQNIFPSKP